MSSRNTGKTKSQHRSAMSNPEDQTYGDTSRWSPVAVSPVSQNAYIVSGSRGTLGKVLEKMHRGEVLSQHEVSAALSDFNQMNSTIAKLESKTRHMTLQVGHVEKITTPQTSSGEQSRETERALREQIKRKDKLIADLQKRLNNLNHVNISKAPRNVAVADLVPPAKVVDNFCNMFELEWSYAYESLKLALKDKERTLHTLFRIVRHAYVFCFDIAEKQKVAMEDANSELQEMMIHPEFIHPVSKLKYRPSTDVSAETQKCIEVGTNMMKDYRNIFVSRSTAGMQELFRKVKLPEIFETGTVSKVVRDYVNRLVELIWLMVIQEPPMFVYWLEPNRTTLPEYFNYFDVKGKYVKQTVWPAIFQSENGHILSKGVIVATDDADDVE